MPLSPCRPLGSCVHHTPSERRDWAGTPTPDARLWLGSVLVSALASILLATFIDRVPGARAVFVEDGPIETLQAVLLIGVGAVFVAAFLRSAGSRALFCLVAAYACIFAVTRELPRCGSAFVGGDVCLPSSWKHSIVLVASALALIALVLRPVDWRAALRLSNLRWTWPSAVVLGYLVAAEGLEKLIYYGEVEELLELIAYFHLAALALSILHRTRHR